jgi:hypothetical protein
LTTGSSADEIDTLSCKSRAVDAVEAMHPITKTAVNVARNGLKNDVMERRPIGILSAPDFNLMVQALASTMSLSPHATHECADESSLSAPRGQWDLLKLMLGLEIDRL